MNVYIIRGCDANAHEGSDTVEYIFLNENRANDVAEVWNNTPEYKKYGIHDFTYYVERKDVIDD